MDVGTLEILLWILAAVLVAVGIAGLVLPALPGAPIVLAGLVLAAWVEDFAHVGWVTLSVLAVMAVLCYVVDFVASALGAQRYGASQRAIWGALIGAVAGLFFGLVGVLLGPFIGAVIGELSGNKTIHEAGRAGFGATVGLVIGAAAKLAIAFSMVGVFLVVRFF
jgi:uncharacterized protein YqgC (DUF456 family)